MISAGAKVIGSFTVGANSKIGAGSVVLKEVPPNCTVVGIPGRVVRQQNVKIPRDNMDQCNLPDPVQEDISTLKQENARLENLVGELERELHSCREKRDRELREREMREKQCCSQPQTIEK